MSMLRVLSGIFFLGMLVFWQISAYKTAKTKPKQTLSFSWYRFLSQWTFRGMQTVLLAQLFGVNLLPMYTPSILFISAGFILSSSGILLCIIARIQLRDNWEGAANYQIKKNHELITHGVYAYIRNPIYTGLIMQMIGAEMVCGSWLWISSFALFFGMYMQSKREEKILLAHFGEEYKNYMQKTKILLPFLF